MHKWLESAEETTANFRYWIGWLGRKTSGRAIVVGSWSKRYSPWRAA